MAGNRCVKTHITPRFDAFHPDSMIYLTPQGAQSPLLSSFRVISFIYLCDAVIELIWFGWWIL